jgi:hypothetical protein
MVVKSVRLRMGKRVRLRVVKRKGVRLRIEEVNVANHFIKETII